MPDSHHNPNWESRWLVLRRCLAILRRLQRGPARKGELLAAVYEAEGAAAYGGATGAALDKRFEADKRRLRHELHTPVTYDKTAAGYVLGESGRPLLDLPDDDLSTLAFLADTFGSDSPRATDVQQLIDRLASWLPAERRQALRRTVGDWPKPDLRLRDKEEIPLNVWNAVHAAWRRAQEIAFDYRTGDEDAIHVRWHHVQPWDVEFTDRGHYRLLGFCLSCDGPDGPLEPRDYRHYRLSRIVSGSVRVLPRKLPPVRPRGHPRRVVFELSPTIARFGVSARKEMIGEPSTAPAADGWTRVEGQTLDVFELARNLLYYGDHCRVLGGPELLEEVRGLVRGLAALYGVDDVR